MKMCQYCGIALPDEAGFCGVCGKAQATPAPVAAPVAPVAPVEVAPVQTAPVEAPYVPPVYVPTAPVAPVAPVVPVAPTEEKPNAISVGGWMGRDLIACIPVAGPLIYFIMLWIWSFKKSNEASFRNWAKSRLIWMAISAGLWIVLFVVLAVLGVSFADVINEALYF